MKTRHISIIGLVLGLVLLLTLVPGGAWFQTAQPPSGILATPALGVYEGMAVGSSQSWPFRAESAAPLANWYIETVDRGGNAGWHTSLALDENGYPHISYFDFASEDLKHAYWNGFTWRIEVVDDQGTTGLYTSLALDGAGHPHISYLDGSEGDLKYAWWDGERWNFQIVDATGYVGEYSSLALDPVGRAHISYYDASNGDLKYAYQGDQNTWYIQTVDSYGRVGQYSSLVVHDGYAHISYWDYVNQNLKYARQDGFGWTIQTFDSAGEVGEYSSLALDGGYAHVSYYDSGNCNLKYAYQDFAGWYIKTVDQVGCVGEYTSLALDAAGYAHISYWDYDRQDLKYAHQDASGWYSQTLDSAGSVGEYSAIALDGDGYPHISYFDRTGGDLKLAHYSDEPPPPESTPTPTPSPTPGDTPTPSPTPTLTPPPPPVTGDLYEQDDVCDQAQPIAVDGTVQDHTFHEGADTDWVVFDAISGTTYIIEAQVPADAPTDVLLELYDQCGVDPQDGQDYAFSPGVRLQFQAPASGPFFIKLLNYDPLVYGPAVAYQLSVRALDDAPSPGALVLVAGRIREDDPLQENIHYVTDAVYRLFLALGYDADHIMYLATDTSPAEVDDLATAGNLEWAITDWAAGKVGVGGTFTLFLMDHGDYDRLYLDRPAGEWVSPEEIDEWLAQLEGASSDIAVNILIEACHSGSFIDLQNTVSGPGRVVISSTGAWNLAYASSLGAIFSDHFISALQQGASLYAAFQTARGAVQLAQPSQTPWLDDDGDGLANEGEDGQIAALRDFVSVETLSDEDWKPYVVQVIGPTEVEQGYGAIRAEVRDDERIRQVWAVIYRPSDEPSDPGGSEMVYKMLPTVVLLDQGDDWYGALYAGFSEIGVYRIVVYAEDRDGWEAQPLAIELKVGWPVYLPLLVRNHR